MDAVEFIRERNRMCDYYAKNGSLAGYADCPMYAAVCNSIRAVTDAYIDIVEKWSREHPRKTRQSEFLKQWPEAKKGRRRRLVHKAMFPDGGLSKGELQRHVH